MGLADPEGPLRFALRLDPARTAPGATVVATLSLRNTGRERVTVAFPSSQRYDLALLDQEGVERWRWSADRMFTMMLREETLAEGARLEWRERVTAPAEEGRYRLEATLAAVDRRTTAHVALDVGG